MTSIGAGHLGVHHVVDGGGGFGHRQPQRVGHLRLDGRLGQLLAERPVAAQEVVGVEVAEHQVGVGDGRLGATQPVAGRARDGARAGRAHLQAAAHVDGGDAAAARAHRVHVDRRQGVLLAVDDLLLADVHLPVGDDGDVEARAAHVGGHQIGDASGPAQADSQSRPGRRAGDEKRRRVLAHHLTGGHPTVALHEGQRPGEAVGGKERADALDELGDLGGHVGAEHGGAPAAHLADGRQHARRQRDVGLRILLLDDLLHAQFMAPGSDGRRAG